MATRKVWAVLQQRDGELHRQSRETVAAAQELAALVDATVDAVVLGAAVMPAAEKLAGEAAVERVLVADHAKLGTYTPGAYIAALASAIREQAPAYVLFPHTYQSVEYFPRLAQQVDGAIVSAVAGFRLVEGAVLWTRPVLGGKLQAEVRVKASSSGPVLASIQPGAVSAERLKRGSGVVEALPVAMLDVFIAMVRTSVSSTSVCSTRTMTPQRVRGMVIVTSPAPSLPAMKCVICSGGICAN